jgi:hypothetical protein
MCENRVTSVRLDELGDVCLSRRARVTFVELVESRWYVRLTDVLALGSFVELVELGAESFGRHFVGCGGLRNSVVERLYIVMRFIGFFP